MTDRRTRLTNDQRMYALALVARGDTNSQVVAALLTDHGVTITESSISQMRKTHSKVITKMQNTMAEAHAADAEDLLRRSRIATSKLLDKAERDANKLEEVDQKYRDGDIEDPEDYRRQKAGLIKLSVAELNAISRTAFAQTMKIPDPDNQTPALPAGSGASPAQLESLVNAISAGNTVELQRLIFTPKNHVTNPA